MKTDTVMSQTSPNVLPQGMLRTIALALPAGPTRDRSKDTVDSPRWHLATILCTAEARSPEQHKVSWQGRGVHAADTSHAQEL